MDYAVLFFLALALSADAFAVSITNGIFHHNISIMDAIKTALVFGFFQALMPILGFVLGNSFSDFVYRYQHWIALFLLGAIGINMLREAIKDLRNPEDITPATDTFSIKNLVLQGIATSIDAFAAGVSLAVLDINIVISALLIGFITFSCCALGVPIGNKFGSLLGLSARFVGALVILAIGLKTFIENQFL